MIEVLQRAFELAQQQPEAEQELIAQFILEELKIEEVWNELLIHPKSETFLEHLAEQARKEHSAGLTHDLDELLDRQSTFDKSKGTRKGMPLPYTKAPGKPRRMGGASPCGCPGSSDTFRLTIYYCEIAGLSNSNTHNSDQ